MNVGVTTVKVHIIQDHLAEKLRETNETLHKTNDEHTEQVHHRLRRFDETHQYKVK